MELRPFGTFDRVELPTHIATDRSHVYVFDDATSRLFVFSPTGKRLATVGRIGDGPGEFFHPSAIATANGRLAVLGGLRQRIQIFAIGPKGPVPRYASATSIRTFDPRTVAINGRGEIFLNKPATGSLISGTATGGVSNRKFGDLTKLSDLYGNVGTSLDKKLFLAGNRVWLATSSDGKYLYAAFMLAPVIEKLNVATGRVVFRRRLRGPRAKISWLLFGHRSVRRVETKLGASEVSLLTNSISVDPITGNIAALCTWDGWSQATVFVLSPSGEQLAAIPVTAPGESVFMDVGILADRLYLTTSFGAGLYTLRGSRRLVPAGGRR